MNGEKAISTKKNGIRKKEIQAMKLSVQELLIVLVIVIVIFGPTQIPKLAKTMGMSIRGFRKGMEEAEEKSEDEKEEA